MELTFGSASYQFILTPSWLTHPAGGGFARRQPYKKAYLFLINLSSCQHGWRGHQPYILTHYQHLWCQVEPRNLTYTYVYDGTETNAIHGW